ncbi:MAG TPA: phosphoribosylformylglycinamidine cyclo-ligase [Thermoanaerobaculaceae bacterium]|nr:phosphoribosylformylglycinamidine cyclo-ligase [Thermoanaerobaculaceae bacterium]HRS16108.1 phosphoribosylformylglycinamidine cyclo-ligase [Thermoanaerobaculaceae bacterium]
MHEPGAPVLTYASAGVDIDAQDRALAGVKRLARSTFTAGVLSEIGAFGGLFTLEPENPRGQVLVASADGVGTKLKVAQMAGVHDTVGEDLVNHCVNDILVCGARPLFFLDYFASGRLEPGVMVSVVEGLARGCRANGCALLGGETAEMPGFYAPGEYDVAGFIVGGCRRDRLLRRDTVAAGDVLVALPSTGLHTNGYSLARRIVFDVLGLRVDSPVPELGSTVAEALLAVHRSYLPAVAPLLDRGLVKTAAHITGGGIPDNLPRALPEALGAEIDLGSWDEPPLFGLLRRAGNVPEDDMRRTFNLGVGMILVVAEARVGEAVEALGAHGPGWVIGRVTGEPGVRFGRR